jgi:hypothetical protein
LRNTPSKIKISKRLQKGPPNSEEDYFYQVTLQIMPQ